MPIPRNQTELNKLREKIESFTSRINREDNETRINSDQLLKEIDSILNDDFELSPKGLEEINSIGEDIFIKIFQHKRYIEETVVPRAIFDLFNQLKGCRKNLLDFIEKEQKISSTSIKRKHPLHSEDSEEENTSTKKARQVASISNKTNNATSSSTSDLKTHPLRTKNDKILQLFFKRERLPTSEKEETKDKIPSSTTNEIYEDNANTQHDDLGAADIVTDNILREEAKVTASNQVSPVQNHTASIKQLLILENPELTAKGWDNLGEDYYHGKNGKPKDYIKARICYEKALEIDSENVNSLYSLGILYDDGKGIKKDLEKAKFYYNKASKLGHKDAKKQFLLLANPTLSTAEQWDDLGDSYYDGKNGKPKDYIKARICYEKALEINPEYSPANYNLAWLYQYSQGVKKDLIKAKNYYEKAAAQNHYDSIRQLLILENAELQTAEEWDALGEDYYYGRNNKSQDHVKARVCYEQAIKLNPKNINSLYSLGILYDDGKGIKNDLEKAKFYYNKASKLGHKDAKKQFLLLANPTLSTAEQWDDLGDSYYDGKNGKPKDYIKARICYEKALEINPEYSPANYNLAWLYQYSQGVKKDLIKAKNYYEKAAAQNHYDSIRQLLILENAELQTAEEWDALGEDYYYGRNNKSQDHVKARVCHEQAIKRDSKNANAHYQLARLYEQGEGGCKKNLEQAIQYYLVSAKNGFILSNNRLLLLAKNGDPDAQFALGQLPQEEAKEKENKDTRDEINWNKEAIKTWDHLAQTKLNSISPHQSFTEQAVTYRRAISYLIKSKRAGSEFAERQVNLLKNQFITSLLYHALRHHIRSVPNLEAEACKPYLELLIFINKNYKNWDAECFKSYIESEETSKHTYFGTDLSDDSDSDEEKSFQRCSPVVRDSALIHSRGFWSKANLKGAKLTLDAINKRTKKFEKSKPVLTPTEKIGKYADSTDQILRDLRELNYWRSRGELAVGLMRSKRTKFAIAQYRGITYKVTDWSQLERRSHRKMVEVGGPLFSSSVYKKVQLPYTTDCLQDPEAKARLQAHADILKEHLISLRKVGPNIEKYGSRKEQKEYSFDSVAERLQNEYTKDYDKFGAILAAGEIKCEQKGSIALNLLNASNPFISTGDIPLHALKYAYGIKPYEGHEHERLHPRWRKDKDGMIGRAERPYSGKTYVTLHTIEEYDHDNPMHVVSRNHLGKLRINDNTKGFQILRERETTFPAYIPEGHVIYTHIAKYPSFNGSYKSIYAIKYGIDEKFYNLFQQALIEFPPHSDELENTKILLGEYLCHYHQFRLMERAQQEATKRDMVLVYVDEFGQLGLNLPLLPSPAKKDTHDLDILRDLRNKRSAANTGLQVNEQKEDHSEELSDSEGNHRNLKQQR